MHKYELDDGTEIHDPTVPSTTTCPYLPGQPVNLLWVPVEVQPPRDRSASMSSMANGDVKTMLPTDKFLTPRAPPPVPAKLSRSRTAPMSAVRDQLASSASPKSEKTLWSPKAFFSRRSSSSHSQKGEKRGLWSPLGKLFGDDTSGRPSSPSKHLDDKRNISLPTTCTTSTAVPQSPLANELPMDDEIPVRQVVSGDLSSRLSAVLPPPSEIDELEEAIEDDDENFAAQPSRAALSGESPPIPTPLSPRSVRRPSTVSRISTLSRPSSTRSKPLPDLPHSDVEEHESGLGPLLPSPMLKSQRDVILSSSPTAATNLRQHSHFSGSTAVTSPTASYFDFSDDEEDDDDDGANSADEVFIDSPASPDYALAEGDAADEDDFNDDDNDDDDDDDWRIKKHAAAAAAVAAMSQAANRRTFGGPDVMGQSGASDGNTLDELRRELGYLGGVIVSK